MQPTVSSHPEGRNIPIDGGKEVTLVAWRTKQLATEINSSYGKSLTIFAPNPGHNEGACLVGVRDAILYTCSSLSNSHNKITAHNP